jgi:hypothetical protein
LLLFDLGRGGYRPDGFRACRNRGDSVLGDLGSAWPASPVSPKSAPRAHTHGLTISSASDGSGLLGSSLPSSWLCLCITSTLGFHLTHHIHPCTAAAFFIGNGSLLVLQWFWPRTSLVGLGGSGPDHAALFPPPILLHACLSERAGPLAHSIIKKVAGHPGHVSSGNSHTSIQSNSPCLSHCTCLQACLG